MASSIFMTGFPGFIARRLVERLVQKDPEATFTFLIEERLRSTANASIQAVDDRYTGFASRTRLVSGDISAPRMGLSKREYEAATSETTQVWHLAAIYNLAVPAAIAYRVNVTGTANVLDFCEDCGSLRRLDYISTCYVSGKRTGVILESELDEGQGFKNHYESTKCWAEIEVRRRMDRVPAAIHRPGIVVGDSRTGETDKYDGPYFVIKLLLKLPPWIPMVNIGAGTCRVNLVPIDFLVAALAEIGTQDESIGSTFHLADPNPHTAREVMTSFLDALGFRRPLLAVPPSGVSGALSLSAVRNLVQIPKEAIIYFNHEAIYDTTNQQKALRNTGISCPDFLSYVPMLVDYVRAHPEKSFLDGRKF